MYSNWLILILFGLSWNFPNVITFGGSGVPFAFIFPTILVIPNFIKSIFIDKVYFHFKIILFFIIIAFTLMLSIYSIQFDPREYLIRLFQIGSAFIVYLYVRSNFYLNVDSLKIFRVLIILQLPSLLFGFFEVINTLLDIPYLEYILIFIRSLTASERANLVSMNTITLHFFEHSMAAYYFISIGLIIFAIFLKEKKVFFESSKIYNFCIILFITIFLFHRSTTFYLLLFIFAFVFVLKSRNIYQGIILLIFISFGVFLSGTIYTKLNLLINGGIIASDLFRLTSMISGFWNFILNPIFGIGPGTWSIYYLDGLYDFFNTLNFDQSIKDLVLLNGYVASFENGGRAPLNSAYMALLAEYGIIFLLFVIYFHGKSFFLKSNLNIVELTILGGLFLGYPLAYPYFWFVLGVVHSNNASQKFFKKS